MSVVILISQSYSLSAKTIRADLPSIDESVLLLEQDSLDLVMEDLNNLDNYLNNHPELSYNDLQSMGSNLISNITDAAAPFGQTEEGENEIPLGIPAFWWGCLLGWIGIILVYILTDSDKEQTGKAFKGFLVTLGTATVLFLIITVADLIFDYSVLEY